METLTFVKRTDSDQQGNALLSKAGKPYTRVSIKVESKGDRYLSGFGNKENENWKVGDEVDITITESDKLDKNGKPYLNFATPKKGDLNGKILEDIYSNTETILNKMVAQQIRIEQILEAVAPKKKTQGYEYPEDNLDEPAF